MAEVKRKKIFPMPLESNVDVGDLLVVTTKTEFSVEWEACPITGRGAHYATAKDDKGKEHTINYSHAIILKQDGTFRIGHMIY